MSPRKVRPNRKRVKRKFWYELTRQGRKRVQIVVRSPGLIWYRLTVGPGKRVWPGKGRVTAYERAKALAEQTVGALRVACRP